MCAGPDLGAIFDEHVASEFEAKDIDATMRTMVKDPYVWHVPVLTGASGGEEVRRFYSTRFIGHTAADAAASDLADGLSGSGDRRVRPRVHARRRDPVHAARGRADGDDGRVCPRSL